MGAGGGGRGVGCRKLVKFIAEQTGESLKRIALNVRNLLKTAILDSAEIF